MAVSKNIIITAQRLFIVSLVLVVMAAYFSIAGCGRKGPPLPPESSMPPGVSGLEARLDGGNIVLSWMLEKKEENMPAGFFIYRGLVVCATCPVRAVRIARVSYKAGPVFTFVDRPAGPGRYEYRVGCFDEYGNKGPVSMVTIFLPPDAMLPVAPEENPRW